MSLTRRFRIKSRRGGRKSKVVRRKSKVVRRKSKVVRRKSKVVRRYRKNRLSRKKGGSRSTMWNEGWQKKAPTPAERSAALRQEDAAWDEPRLRSQLPLAKLTFKKYLDCLNTWRGCWGDERNEALLILHNLKNKTGRDAADELLTKLNDMGKEEENANVVAGQLNEIIEKNEQFKTDIPTYPRAAFLTSTAVQPKVIG